MANKRAIERCLNIADMRVLAKRRAHKMVFDYIDGGSGDEITLARNSGAFSEYPLVHRVLKGVARVDTSVEILGETWAKPFCLSPAAGNRLFHIDGERAVAHAAADHGVPYTLSTLSSVSMEDIAAIGDGPRWFQLYVWKDRELVSQMLRRAKDAGYTKLVLTADFPLAGKRERDVRNGFTIPPTISLGQAIEAVRKPRWTWDYLTGASISYANLSTETPAVSLAQFVAEQLDADFDWDDAAWLIEQWQGDVLLKGVLHPNDVKRAQSAGFAGVILSNHGGRQLDAEAAPLDALLPARKAAGPDYPLILDGGIRRGTDIIKAIALGATAVSFARPYLYGLSAGGYLGVKRVLDIISEELALDMALTGARNIARIGVDMLLANCLAKAFD